MDVKFFDREDGKNPLNGRILDQHVGLSELLSQLQSRAPFFCEVIAENGYTLLLGIGPRGCAQFSRTDGSPPYLMAVSHHPETSTERFEFLAGGTLTPVSTRYCLPFDAVKDIAAYFQRTGERSATFAWEEI